VNPKGLGINLIDRRRDTTQYTVEINSISKIRILLIENKRKH